MEKIVRRNAYLAKYRSTGEYVIKIDFDFNYDDLSRVKGLLVRQYHADEYGKYWTTPLTEETLLKLIEWKYTIDSRLTDFLSEQKKLNTFEEVSVPIKIPGLKGKLFPYQGGGVSFLESRNGRALIADEQGLGKTIQALAYLELHPEIRPALIVCPKSVKLNWEREANKWMSNPKVQVIVTSRDKLLKSKEIFIVNYDILNACLPMFAKLHPTILIGDEIQKIKSNTARRTKAFKRIAKTVPHLIALSGTPVMNRPIEIFNAVNLINCNAIPPYWVYVKEFCNAKHNGYGWDFNGSSNTEKLHQMLTSTVMIRRLKKDVLKDLPNKIYSIVPMEIDNENEYFKAENHFISYIKETKGQIAAIKAAGAEVLTQIESLKQLAVIGKLNESIEWIKDFLEGNQKLVIFAVHKFVIDTLMTAFPDISVKIDGSVNMYDRDKAVQSFQNDPKIKLFVGNIQAAGVGITLTAASNVIVLEYPWSPSEIDQAIDRLHRIGQKESVTVHYLLANGTIEERIAKLLDHKRKVVTSILDGQAVEQESLLSELLKEYRNSN
jgi:SWI/SNF-related matrix-associated actin-dependent regulator 1 of chromatin subfamily A